MDGTADLRYLLCYRPASKQYHNHLALSLAKLLERPFFFFIQMHINFVAILNGIFLSKTITSTCTTTK